jgi:Holliday junction resolvase RusA-like endonuclease
MERLTFEVVGIPAPQGSKRAYVRGTKAVLVESSDKVKPWRAAVAWTARQATRESSWYTTAAAVTIAIDFTLPRPKSLPKRIVDHVKKPDIDKLIRSTLDGISDAGTIWNDDSQVTKVIASKKYGDATGALIGIEVQP